MPGDKASWFRGCAIDLRRLVSRLAAAPFARTDACFVFFALVLFVAGASSSPAWAAREQERLIADKATCRLFVGPDAMTFTGYQPDLSRGEYCEDIPSIGRAILVLDYEQAELRDMLVAVRIVKDVGHEAEEPADIDSATVAYRAPKLYPNGTINLEHNFNDPGNYVGIVTVTGAHGETWVSRFPFSVGKAFTRSLPTYLLMAVVVLAGCLVSLNRITSRQTERAGKPSGQGKLAR